MIPYLLLLPLAGLFSFVTLSSEQGGLMLLIGNEESIQRKNMCLGIFFLMLFALLACRDVSIGNDTWNYQHYYFKYAKMSLMEVWAYEDEGIFKVFNWIVARITRQNFQLYLAFVSVITIFPIAKLYMEDASHSYLQVVLFANMSIFVMLFSGIRQAIAMAIGVYAFRYVRQNKLLKFLFCVVVAFGFHTSSFILLIMYPVYNLRIMKKDLWSVLPVFVIVFLFGNEIFSLLVKILAIFSPKYADSEATQTGAYAMLVLFGLFAVFAYLTPDETKMNRDLVGMRNFLLLSVLLQCFAPIFSLSMRMNYYFIPFIPAIIARLMSIPNNRYRNVVLWAEMIMCVFFTGGFIMSIIQAASTGGMLNIVPYVPFWEV